MKFTIKDKLILTLCMPLIVMGGFTISNLLNTKDAVLAVEKANVSSEFKTLLNANMKGQVDTLTLSVSDYYEESKLENVKKSLTAEMATFASTIENIYNSEASKTEAKQRVYSFLNYHRWDNKRYLLAYDARSYITRANGADINKVGSNAFNDQDANDKYFARDIVQSAITNEVGFTEYSFLNPVTQTIERKITASFYFQPLNLVIASGEYISTLMQTNIDAARKAVAKAKYGTNGYFWIQDKDGVLIAHPDSKIVGKSLPTTIQVAETVKGKTEANLVIKYNNPATGEAESKIVYVRNIFPEWGWSIATGAYESDIIAAEEGLTKATQDIFEEKTNFIIVSSVALIVFALIIVIWIVTAIIKGMVVLKDRIDTLSTGEADLTSRIDIVADNELGDIGKSVNTFISYLQSMMRDVAQASQHITENISQLNIQSEQNNKALLAHAAETEQVVSAITEMSATSDTVAQGASETSLNTQKANDQAVISKDIVTEASNSVIALVDEVEAASSSINTMNENTQQIISVLSVIGAIAEQTNLLALNAAIEAARAGEQGRGFAVVADEVRSLAARTQTSTAEIGKILDTLRHDTASAVSAMDLTKASCERTAENTGRVTESLDSMSDFIVEINDLSTQIATASEEQSSVSEEVNCNMVNIHEMVQELTRNGQASVDSTQNLATANAQLNALVSKFKL